MWHVWNVNPAFTKDGKREIRKRRREALSCERCRRLKVRCDRRLPCGHCKRSKHDDQCHYISKTPQDPTATKEPPKKKVKAVAQSQPRPGGEMIDTGDVCNNGCSGSSEPSRSTSPESVSSSLVRFPGNMLSFHSISDSLAAGAVGNSCQSAPDPEMYAFLSKFRIWNSKYRGETHWFVFVKEFASVAVSFRRNTPSQPTHPRTEDDDVTNYSKLPLLKTSPEEYILSILPDREAIDGYVENYFRTVEQIYRLLHVPSFRREARAFWVQDPEKKHVDWDWLSLFMMIIGLGYLTSPNANMKRVKRLFRGAEICLMQTSFLLRPTIRSIKAICMMVISKHMGEMSCDEYDSCSPLMGIVVRQAMSMGLHYDPAFSANAIPLFQAEMHRRLWATILQIEVQQSLTSGMPPLVRIDDFNTLPPLNLNDDDLDPLLSTEEDVIVNPRPDNEYTDSSFQILLTQSLSPALEIVAEANSLSGTLSYAKVLELDARIRYILSQVSMLRSHLSNEPDETKRHPRLLQISMLEISLRRILVILHRQFTRAPTASAVFPASYWTLLESSLALLVHQRQIYEDESSWRTTKWFAEIFKNDFFLATVVIGIQLCRRDNPALEASVSDSSTGVEMVVSSPVLFPPSPSSSSLSEAPLLLSGFDTDCSSGSDGVPVYQGAPIPPRLTMLQALKWCQDIWVRKLTKSFCQSRVTELIGDVIRSVECGT